MNSDAKTFLVRLMPTRGDVLDMGQTSTVSPIFYHCSRKVYDFTYFCSSTPWSDVKLFSETLKRAIYAFPDDVFTAILFVTPVAAVAFIFIDTITVQDVG